MIKIFFVLFLCFPLLAQPASKTLTVFFHGLNNKPSVFNDLIQKLPINSLVSNTSLPSQPRWLAHVKKELLQSSAFAQKNHCDWQIVGFSLGALLSLLALDDMDLAIPPKRVLFFAPAFTPRHLDFLKTALSLIPEDLILPSFAPEEIRAQSGTMVNDYLQLFSLAEQIQKKKLKKWTFPITVFYSHQDELVDAIELKKFSRQNGWELQKIETKNSPHHLLIQKKIVTPDSWQKIQSYF